MLVLESGNDAYPGPVSLLPLVNIANIASAWTINTAYMRAHLKGGGGVI